MVAESEKVVSDMSSAVAVGSSSMTITGTLALFAALWARVLKKERIRNEADQIQDTPQEMKDYKYIK